MSMDRNIELSQYNLEFKGKKCENGKKDLKAKVLVRGSDKTLGNMPYC